MGSSYTALKLFNSSEINLHIYKTRWHRKHCTNIRLLVVFLSLVKQLLYTVEYFLIICNIMLFPIYSATCFRSAVTNNFEVFILIHHETEISDHQSLFW